MKKTLVAIAVSSAALTSVSAFAADDTVNFDVYGNIQLVYADSKDSGSEIEDNGSTFGFQGSTAISDDLTGFFKYELEADADQKTSDIDVNLDQAYVGLQGSFGKVQVGSFDTPYNNAIQDSLDQFEYLGAHAATLTSEGDTIAFYSPSIYGFEFQTSMQIKGSADDSATSNETDNGTASQMVLKYSVDALTVALGYDNLANVIGKEDTSTYGLNVGFQVNPALSVSFQYEDETDVAETFGLGARFNYGSGDLYGTVQTVDQEGSATDYDMYGIGATYNLASNMYVYAEYGQTGSTEDKVTAAGATYLF
mgnify:CR=1 FL=1